MGYLLSLVVVLVISPICFNFCMCSKLRIGIVGGGIGGTSACYFLQELLKDTVTIDVYEPYEIGGRLATTLVDDLHYETGGSIIHEDNRYVQQLMQAFNLSKRVNQPGNVPSRFGLFDGTKFLFKESSYNWLTVMKMLYHYGPINVYRFQSAVHKMLQEFANIYSLQEQKQSYSTVEQMLAAMSNRFVSQLTKCADDGMTPVTSQLLLDELISAGNLVNYGQTVFNMPEFVTFVSCAGMSGSLFSIAHGNKQLATGALNACRADLVQNKVTRIEYDAGQRKYVVHSKSGVSESDSVNQSEAEDVERVYDFVIIATPLSLSGIQFVNMEGALRVVKEIKYHVTVTTLVKGTLNPNITQSGVTEILLTHPFYYYNSLSRLSSTNGVNTAGVYKLFSQSALSKEDLDRLFTAGAYEVVYEKHWRAYPEYRCRENECGKYAKEPSSIEREKIGRDFRNSRDLKDEKVDGNYKENGQINEGCGLKDGKTIPCEKYGRDDKDCTHQDGLKTEDCKLGNKDCVKDCNDDSECRQNSPNCCDSQRGKHWDKERSICIEERGSEYCKESRDGYIGSDEEQDIGEYWGGTCEAKEGGRECMWTKKSNADPVSSERTDESNTKTDKTNTEMNDNEHTDNSNVETVEINVEQLDERNSANVGKIDAETAKTSPNVFANSRDTNEITETNNEQTVNDERIDKASDEHDAKLYERIEKRKITKNLVENTENAGQSGTNIDESNENAGESSQAHSNNEKDDFSLDKHSFKLHERLYYVNVIEMAASAMEMSLIGAKNVALLVYKDIEQNS